MDDDPDRTALQLADRLRAAGLTVGTDQVVTCARALRVLAADAHTRASPASGPGQAQDRYWAGRVTLLRDPADVAVYDAVVAGMGREPHDIAPPPTPTATADAGREPPVGAGGPGGGDEELTAGGVASVRDRLRHRRFDRVDDDELADIQRALEQLEVAVPHRRSRRWRAGSSEGPIDLPRVLAKAVTTDGELLDLPRLTRRRRPRRVVLLLDVSGSMASFARALLRFAIVARRSADGDAARQVEVFAFGTRLTRLTEALSDRDPDAALARAASEVVDWDGGTRIGQAVDELTRRWGRRGVLRGAVVVVVSDGLERGEPDALSVAMARLRRHAYRIVWVNPLAGDPRFEPRQRGMRAALPHVDRFLPGHDLASLEELSRVLADLR